MNKIEKSIVLSTFLVSVIYIVLFNLNFPHYWNNSPIIFPDRVVDILWYVCFALSLITFAICIVDTGKRKLNSRASWVIYMVLIGVIAIPHYYIKYGGHPRVGT
jgi:hypothetical protein